MSNSSLRTGTTSSGNGGTSVRGGRGGGRAPSIRGGRGIGRTSGSDHNTRSPLSYDSIHSRQVEDETNGRDEDRSPSQVRTNESLCREDLRSLEEEQDLRFITIHDFTGDKAVLETISGIIKGNFHGAWRTYTHVPREVRDRWWNVFKHRYWWEEKNSDVESAFHTRGGTWLNHTLAVYRKNEQRPDFVSEGHWKELMEFWCQPEYAGKSEKAKRNSEKGKEKQYYGGRISVTEHTRRMEKENNKKPPRLEVFKRCITKKNALPPPVVAKTMNDFESLLTQKSQESENGSNSVDEDAVFVEVVGVAKKRCFGLGSEALRVTSKSLKGSNSETDIPPRWRGEIEKQVASRFEKEKAEIMKACEEQKAVLANEVKLMKFQFSQFMDSVRGTNTDVPRRRPPSRNNSSPSAHQNGFPNGSPCPNPNQAFNSSFYSSNPGLNLGMNAFTPPRRAQTNPSPQLNFDPLSDFDAYLNHEVE